MKSDKSKKTYDAVRMMREIRDKISAETAGMTYEELKTYIKTRLKRSGLRPLGQ